jgi:hypothetical protein
MGKAVCGRRVMWAWLSLLSELNLKTLQSLPGGLTLGADSLLQIRPICELVSLRHDGKVIENFHVESPHQVVGGVGKRRVAELEGDTFEIQVRVPPCLRRTQKV